jgi:hypothetical protein
MARPRSKQSDAVHIFAEQTLVHDPSLRTHEATQMLTRDSLAAARWELQIGGVVSVT